MEQIKATIQQTIFHNPENGYSVFQVMMDEGNGKCETVVGTFSGLSVGTMIAADGEWRNDKRYGRQFAVQSWHEVEPSTVKGMENYLGSGLISGIGKSTARDIVAHFGLQTLEVIDKNPDRLLEVPGIGKKRLGKIKKSWEKQKGVKDVMVFLQGYGISAAYAVKIYKEYKNDSIKKVKENPYCLADDVFGIGFKMADEIASRMGYGKDDPRRLKAGVVFTLNQMANDGHCFAGRDQLMKQAVELLQAGERPIAKAVMDMTADGSIVEDDGALFLPMSSFL